MAEQGLIVVISGMPASGKTSLARRLAPVIGLPIVDKDVILEILFDALGTGDAEWRQFLSRSSDNVLRRIAQAHSSVILTSFWRHPKSRECGSGTPIGWIGDLPGTIVELYCACPSGLAFERFQDRSRHAGHLDGHRNVDRLRQQLAEAEEHGPLRVGKLIEVDTSVSVDLQRLIQLIEMVQQPLLSAPASLTDARLCSGHDSLKTRGRPLGPLWAAVTWGISPPRNEPSPDRRGLCCVLRESSFSRYLRLNTTSMMCFK